MTYKEINTINGFVLVGVGPQKIAEYTSISVNTIKSYLQRHPGEAHLVFCQHCGKVVDQYPGRKPKHYCSDQCRMAYWNSHKDEVNKQAFYKLTCKHCGKEFTSYGNINRKYCSRSCYADARKKTA